MARKILPLVIIFAFALVAWMILGAVTELRTSNMDRKLKGEVGKLWGAPHNQSAPRLYLQTKREVEQERMDNGRKVVETVTKVVKDYLPLDSSEITVKLDLDHRKKGLLWYPTYRVSFHGIYSITNHTSEPQSLIFQYDFPVQDGLYDDFTFLVDGRKISDINPIAGSVYRQFDLEPGQSRKVAIGYGSQGMDQWRYELGSGVTQTKNFSLSMTTDFEEIDFPDNTISPTETNRAEPGWELGWQYDNLISGVQIGMDMPQKLNPGPFVSRVSFFAPVSLLFFFFVIFMISTIRGNHLHPMNYFFLASAFFAFHLLAAYLVDHINVHAALLISSVVSVGLVTSYMRLVTGLKFALLYTGLAQLVYLVFFSYAFFWEGFTGLAITICAIATLFVAMQLTGRIDWNEKFSEARSEKM